MIVKEIRNTSERPRDIRYSVRYVVDAKGGLDPSLWRRTAEGVLEIGPKASSVRLSHCRSQDPAMATLEILDTLQRYAKKNPDDEEDRVYHMVVAFPKDERPTLEKLAYIEDELCQVLGYEPPRPAGFQDAQEISPAQLVEALNEHGQGGPLTYVILQGSTLYGERADRSRFKVSRPQGGHVRREEMANSTPGWDAPAILAALTAAGVRIEHRLGHQRITAVHEDTEHLHLHVVICKVHPQKLTVANRWRSHKRLMEARERLERELNLTRVGPVSRDTRDSSLVTLYRLPEMPEQTPSGERWTSNRESVQGQGDIESLIVPADLIAQHAFSPEGSPGEFIFSGSGPADLLRQHQEPELYGRPADLEAHRGEESFLRFMREKLRDKLKAATSWDSFHVELGRHELSARPRGDGLVIGDGRVWVRASQVDRALSFGSLTKRFGPFRPSHLDEPQKGAPPAGGRRRPQPLHRHPSTQQLWERYQQLRQARTAERQLRLERLRAAHAQYAQELANWYQARRYYLRRYSVHFGRHKYLALRKLSEDKAKDFAERSQLERASRARIVSQTRIPSWQRWLIDQAQSGDPHALSVLRSKALRSRTQPTQSTVRPETSVPRANRVFPERNPKVDKRGTVRYDTPDRGQVRDEPELVHIVRYSDEAIEVALLIAQMSFAPEEPLEVTGSLELKTRVATIAGRNGYQIRFAAPSLERLRLVSRGTAPGGASPPG